MYTQIAHFGLKVWYGSPMVMTQPHRHNEIELNLVEHGAITYLWGAASLTIRHGAFAAFWGTIPHQLIHIPEDTSFYCLTLPLAWFLSWQLPTNLTRRVLAGQLVLDESQSAYDLMLFQRWWDDLKDGAKQNETTLRLEAEARLRRLAVISDEPARANKPVGLSTNTLSKAEVMALFIAQHYTEPLTVRDVAAAVELHPNYAMKLFHDTFDISIVGFLTQHRIAHAQRLLVTTNKAVLEIALESGFGSLSRFYAVFQQACGQSPRNYRLALQTGYRDGPKT